MSGNDGSVTPRGRQAERPTGLALFASIERRTDNGVDDVATQGKYINSFLRDVTQGDESVHVDYWVRKTERQTRFVLSPASLTYYKTLVAAAGTKLRFPYRIEQSQSEGRDRTVSSLRQLDDGLPTVVIVRDTLYKHLTPERILFIKLALALILVVFSFWTVVYLFDVVERRR